VAKYLMCNNTSSNFNIEKQGLFNLLGQHSLSITMYVYWMQYCYA